MEKQCKTDFFSIFNSKNHFGFLLIKNLKEHPNKEKECRLSLGYGLGSTHYWYWDPETNMFMHSRDWDFEPYTASQVVKWYGEGKWKIEQ